MSDSIREDDDNDGDETGQAMPLCVPCHSDTNDMNMDMGNDINTRHVRVATGDTGDEQTPSQHEAISNVFVPPIDRLLGVFDVLDVASVVDSQSVYIIGTRDSKVTTMSDLSCLGSYYANMSDNKRDQSVVKEVTLRSCLISRIDGLAYLKGLEKLELYDNVIEQFDQLELVADSLLVLDVSFNAIRYIPMTHDMIAI
jgi:hypothetical protein